MNGKALIPLVAGLGIGGFALKLGLDTLRDARGAQKPAEKVQIWAAAADIHRGTAITEEMLQPATFPVGLVPEGAFKEEDQEQLLGRIPRLAAPAGLPILESMLLEPGTRAGIHVKPGFRAVAVKIDESSGVDYHLEPGCFVDVVGSFKVRRNRRQETLARTIIENAEVAAVGRRISPGAETEEEGKNRSRAVRAVTLFVKPNDVPTLLLAEQRGRIKLSLRSEKDTTPVDRDLIVSDLSLTGEEPETEDKPEPSDWPPQGFAIAVAEPAPAEKPWVLNIFRGNEIETVRFKNRDSAERVDEAQEEKPKQSSTWPTRARPVPFPAPVRGREPEASQGTQGADGQPEEASE